MSYPTQNTHTEATQAFSFEWDYSNVRLELVSILKHRRTTLMKGKDFPGKAYRIHITEKLIRKFENLTACKEELLWWHIKDESAFLIFLFAQDTKWRNERERLMAIVDKSLNQNQI